jgi:tRNA modification GTPase
MGTSLSPIDNRDMIIQEETIAAIATPPGAGGVGIIRLSGLNAYSIALNITKSTSIKKRQVIFRSFYGEDLELIDHGIVLYFKAPHSFTGEDVIELQAHGSPIVLNQLLHLCISYGARLARPGEFSERAFLNDKIDLTQAEAIADLISASSQTAARLAIRSLQGEFSERIHVLNQHIITLRLYVEAAIDFPEEEIDFLNDGKIASMLDMIFNTLEDIQKNASQGSLIREGGIVVIAGPPNAGKSTLINALSGYDVAIVTDIAGTTRDVMRESILLDDIPLQIVDTAGLRETDDVIEKEGIKRAWQAIAHADCVLMVCDVQDTKNVELSDAIKASLPPNVPLIRVVNKIDKINQLPKQTKDKVYLSAKEKQGLSLLKNMIKEAMGYCPTEGAFLARQRHLDALTSAHTFLVAGREQLLIHRAGELLADDLRRAHQSLCAITGEFTSDDLLGVIFSSFCIGK